MITATVIQTAITSIQAEETITTEKTITHSDDKHDLQKQLSDFIKAQHSTNSFVKDTFMDLKNKLKTTTKNYQALIQNLEAKFDKFADKQSGRPSGSLPSNTQPNPKAKNMLVEVGKFTFPADFVILEMEEDSKVLLILGRPFLHTTDAVIRVKQKQLVGSKIIHTNP
ncbi:reverse transcriptase domain-containing protein [Tanacetum coccineum]